MRIMALAHHTRLALGALIASAALFAAIAALPSSGAGDAVSSVAPQSAQAYEGGVDGDHAWIKVTAGEIAGGAVEGICRAIAPGPVKAVCPKVAEIARNLIGSAHGVWAEVYATGQVNSGTW